MYIARMQGEKIALKVFALALHGMHVAPDLFNNVCDG